MSQKSVQVSSQARLIVIGVALLLTLGMGIRQSFGLFLTPVSRDLALTAADFTLTLAIQNIVWGLSQAFVGATADRHGLRITMMVGAAIYILGLAIMAVAQGLLALIISGSLIGVALSCTATSLGIAACVRAVSEERRSMTLGLVSAAGSVGTVIVPLATQALLAHERWQIAVLLFLAMALVMLPAAFWAGGADKMPVRSTTTSSMSEVLGQAIRNRQFLVMSGAYFVCGLNLIFLTTHLPNYLAFCGQDPMLSAEALAVIGGTSAVGSLVTGWLGARYPKHILLGLIYILGLSYSLLILRCRPRRRPRCCSQPGWVCFGGPAWHHSLVVWLPRFSARVIWRPCLVYPALCTRLARRLEPGVAA